MANMTTMNLARAAAFFVAAAAAPALVQAASYSPAATPAPPATVKVVTNGPQASAGDFDWSPRRDVIRSAEYDRLLETDPIFRRMRERKECGPIGDPALHRRCITSFDEYEPVAAASRKPAWRHVAARLEQNRG